MARAACSLVEGVDYSSFGASVLGTIPATPRNDCLGCLSESQHAGLEGRAFLESVMRLIWTVLEPRMLFLAVVTRDDAFLRSIITYLDGRRTEGFTYPVAHSPCSSVLGPQALCIYPSDVAGLFPRDMTLQRLRAEGYVGMPLLSRSGERIGMLGAITVHPILNLDEVRGVLKVFGTRLSLELERMLADDDSRADVMGALHEEEQRLLRAADSAVA